MAKDKKGVLLYCDIINTVEKLKDADAGKLFKHYLRYVNDLNPEAPSSLIEIVFEPIKQQLKRDLVKYEEKKVYWSDAGKKSAEAKRLLKVEQEKYADKKNRNSTESTFVENVKQNSTESTVTDKVIVTDTVKVKDKVKVKVKEIKKEVHSLVFLTEDQIISSQDYFLDRYTEAITELSNYKHRSGRTYKSDYHALIGWVAKKMIEEKEKSSGKKESKIDRSISSHNEALEILKSQRQA